MSEKKLALLEPRLTWLPTGVAVFILLVAGVSLDLRNQSGGWWRGAQPATSQEVPGDFAVYARALERVQAGRNPYVGSDPSPYKYSPGALAFLRLLGRVDLQESWAIFKALCLLSWGLALLAGVRFDGWQEVGLLLLGLALSWKGLLETLDYGQIEFLVLVASVFAAGLQHRGWHGVSGFLLGLLPWFKLPWGFLLLPFLLQAWAAGGLRRYGWGVGLGSFCMGVLLPGGWLGGQRAWELTQAWGGLLRAQPPELFWSDINQSVWSTAGRWLLPAWQVFEGGASGASWGKFLAALAGVAGSVGLLVALAGIAVSLFAHATVAHAARRVTVFPLAPAPDAWPGALAWVTPWLIVMQLLNPLSWRWGSLLLVGVPFTYSRVRRHKSFAGACPAWVAASLLLALQQNPLVRLLGYQHWTQLHGYGVITLYWLALLWLSARLTRR